MRIFYLFIICQLSFPLTVNADSIRIGSWNIQDLHHKENYHLRDFGGFKSVKRKSKDYELLKKYRDLFGNKKTASAADIIALQEIGTKAALNRVFPSNLYETIISPRWKDDNALPGEGDVYTAIAIRINSGIKIVKKMNLPELAVPDADGNLTRAGTGAILKIGNSKVAFLSVHLKSGCKVTKKPNKSPTGACKVLWDQMPFLQSWVKKIKEDEIPIIIAGDFNRAFRMLNYKGPVLKAINGVAPKEDLIQPLFSAHPLKVTRKCETRKGNPEKEATNQPIDWILIDKELSRNIVKDSFWESRFTMADIKKSQYGKGLSDHCPISIDMDF